MFEGRAPEVLLSVVREAHRQESVLMARKLDAIAELLGLRVEEELAVDLDMRSVITGFARTTAEVSAQMNLTPAAARQLVAAAETLECRLRRIAALLAAGRVDWRTVEIIIARTELVDDDKCAQLDEYLAGQVGGWSCWSRQRIINAVDYGVKTIDAGAAKQRRVVAFDERAITVDVGPDGVVRVRGTLGIRAGAVFDARLSELAGAVCKDDPRTFTQRRADAVEPAVLGRALRCGCENPDCPAAGDEAPPSAVRTVLNVIAPAATVTGDGEQPGYLGGVGVIDAEQVRDLAQDADRRPVAQPQVSDSEALRYRPSAALDRYIRCRDMTCRFPGCTVPADRCDVDHTVPFNHGDPGAGGLTVPWNLACYCRQHHRLKTFHGGPDGWGDEQLLDGTIVWTAPTGQVYRSTPGGVELFPELRPTPPRSAPERQRIAAARQRLQQRRAVNEYHHYRNWSAARDLYGRQFRNRVRKTRVLFHGQTTTDKPSTSPFCRWINDPLEPEHLPPDWEPPPRTSSDPDEPPPF